jgi:hypothetical protein
LPDSRGARRLDASHVASRGEVDRRRDEGQPATAGAVGLAI